MAVAPMTTQESEAPVSREAAPRRRGRPATRRAAVAVPPPAAPPARTMGIRPRIRRL
jgi:hypothetical protein